MNVKQINETQLNELLGEGKTVVCDFFATWCGPCRMLGPVMEELAGEFADKAEFVKIDVDENMEAARKYAVMSIPLVLVLQGDTVKAKSLGYLPPDEMRLFLLGNL